MRTKKMSGHLEQIICPECESIETAEVQHTTPFWAYVHICSKCGHAIIESEWEKAAMTEELNLEEIEARDWHWAFEDDAKALIAEVRRLRDWVNDLHSGMFINCVYCGHRYGPKDKVPCAMSEVLKQHIEQCPKHPMSALKTWQREAAEAMTSFLEQIPPKGKGFVQLLSELKEPDE